MCCKSAVGLLLFCYWSGFGIGIVIGTLLVCIGLLLVCETEVCMMLGCCCG